MSVESDKLRKMVDEPTEAKYTTELLDEYIASSGSVEAAASVIWSEKAAATADLVDVSEGGSNRKLGDLHKHALSMAAHWGAAAAANGGATGRRPARTRAIVREDV